MKIIEGVLIIIVAVLICNEVGTFLTSSNQKAEEEKAFRIECLPPRDERGDGQYKERFINVPTQTVGI